MVLQYYQNLKEMTSNTFHIVAFVVGFKCPRKIHLNTQCPSPIFTTMHHIFFYYLTPSLDAFYGQPLLTFVREFTSFHFQDLAIKLKGLTGRRQCFRILKTPLAPKVGSELEKNINAIYGQPLVTFVRGFTGFRFRF